MANVPAAPASLLTSFQTVASPSRGLRGSLGFTADKTRRAQPCAVRDAAASAGRGLYRGGLPLRCAVTGDLLQLPTGLYAGRCPDLAGRMPLDSLRPARAVAGDRQCPPRNDGPSAGGCGRVRPPVRHDTDGSGAPARWLGMRIDEATSLDWTTGPAHTYSRIRRQGRTCPMVTQVYLFHIKNTKRERERLQGQLAQSKYTI